MFTIATAADEGDEEEEEEEEEGVWADAAGVDPALVLAAAAAWGEAGVVAVLLVGVGAGLGLPHDLKSVFTGLGLGLGLALLEAFPLAENTIKPVVDLLSSVPFQSASTNVCIICDPCESTFSTCESRVFRK